MFIDSYWNFYFILMFIGKISNLSYNQPVFCSNASWNSNATTFADQNIIGSNPFDIFITTNNTVYVPNQRDKYMIIWSDINLLPTKNISIVTSEALNVFVTDDSLFFAYVWNSTNGIRRITSNSSDHVSVLELCPKSYDIFIDIYNNIYYSLDSIHQVARKSLNNKLDSVQVVAGTGSAGSTSYMLNTPNGIFVDTNSDLYVADHINSRIQLFPLGKLEGITVVGAGSLYPTITLYKPTGIVLDANKYPFVVNYGFSQIIAGGPLGFRCLLGCNGIGSAADQLRNPRSMSFDSFGNIFVVDELNHRIQKFTLILNSCNETIPSIINTSNHSNLVITNISNDISYNQPKLDPLTVWNPNGITFADNSTIGQNPFGIFINNNNTIYVPSRQTQRILIWENETKNPTTIYTNVPNAHSIFVTSNRDIYTIDQMSTWRINKWKLNSNNSDIVTYLGTESLGIFVDINNTLYFSVRHQHKVMKKSLISISNIFTIIAGTGCSGNARNTLFEPLGIFVDDNYDLYVADFGNNRIQRFLPGRADAITVAGTGTIGDTITLDDPISVILDADKYLFIVEYGNNRIVCSGPNGFRCLFGCTRLFDSTSDKFKRPAAMAFDTYGNIYVVDEYNHRIQKFLRLNNTLLPSYNQPKLCLNATWNINATIFADNNIIGISPFTLFINTNNTIFAVNPQTSHVHIWFNNSTSPNITLHTNVTDPKSIFVTFNGDIYIYNAYNNGQVDKLTMNSNKSISVMSVPSHCFGLFVDISNSLYCSVGYMHHVLKKWLGDNNSTISTMIAGTGLQGSSLNMLNSPNGIFVDTNFDLYVADCGNDRIQLFGLGKIYGKIVAGKYSTNPTIELNRPLNVILDNDKNLFIADCNNHRIVASGPYGFRCIVGCSNSSGATSSKLNLPRSITFDSYGNLFVVDEGNNQIQKFSLLTISCNEMTTQESILFSTNYYNQTTVRSNLFSPCDLLDPCKNQGTCIDNITTIYGYVCICKSDFSGINCQYDNRICRADTCWNNGICHVTSNTTFECSCQLEWTGEHCQLITNYCQNITCKNHGVCRRLFLNYTCECLSDSFTGEHCEKENGAVIIFQMASKSIAYVCIIFLSITAVYIITMDILKYIFHIDLTKKELKCKIKKKIKHRSVVQRFIYVIDAAHMQELQTTIKNMHVKETTV